MKFVGHVLIVLIIFNKNGFPYSNNEYFIKMSVDTLSLVELKKLAKVHNPPIKYYYIKSRVELIQILTSEFTEQMKIEKMTIHQLKKQAQSRGVINVWKMNRKQLVDYLYPSTKENNHNNDHTEEHNNPKTCESE